ncbi:MAG TPA: hypothetical protein PKE40_04045 [Arachnia sp.]|nr:hypothetical protein [Arachnia sp.]HMT85503.1 hypothetical protein [Arachnia sp.]
MSTAPPPPDSPWAQQDPHWRPPQFHDAAGRDPRAPFGRPAPPPPTEPLEPKGPGPRVWIAVAVAALIVAVGLFSLQFFIGVDPEDTAPTLPPVVTQPEPTRSGNFKPFDGAVTGVFEITASRWTDSGLEVDYRIEVEQVGDFTFFAYTNSTRNAFEPEPNLIVTAFPDEPATGTLVFPMPNADTTVVLSGPSGKTAIQALPVKAE